ncbi:hypothetical protein BKA69DRAFT_304142 [Paraphysoderma sedebokerense]|nr:hypothetical protein BKA69DRAFT_304142 [Paraphysoderma sedebokerense]
MHQISLLTLLVLVALTSTNANPLTLVKRRFGQQNPPVEGKINAFGGNFATLSGKIPSTLLGAADPCDQAKLADQMIEASAALDGAKKTEFISLVQEYMSVEKNFNPFVENAAPKFCNDPNLPVSTQLKGILPQVDETDPKLINAKETNALTKKRNADIVSGAANGATLSNGKSIQQQMIDLGFTTCVGCNGAGKGAAPPAKDQGNNNGAKKEEAKKNQDQKKGQEKKQENNNGMKKGQENNNGMKKGQENNQGQNNGMKKDNQGNGQMKDVNQNNGNQKKNNDGQQKNANNAQLQQVIDSLTKAVDALKAFAA